VLVQEGDHVKVGQVMARLDPTRIEPQVAKAEADVAAEQQVVNRLHAGTRPEEVSKDAPTCYPPRRIVPMRNVNTTGSLSCHGAHRGVPSVGRTSTSAKAALDVAAAKLAVNRKALDLQVAGPRKEDIAQAEAQLRSDEAQLALLRANWRTPSCTRRSMGRAPRGWSSPVRLRHRRKRPLRSRSRNPKWIRPTYPILISGAFEKLAASVTYGRVCVPPVFGLDWLHFAHG